MQIFRFDRHGHGKFGAMHKSQGSIDGEQKAFYEIVLLRLKQWNSSGDTDHKPGAGISRTPEVAHTSNQWQSKDNWRDVKKSATVFIDDLQRLEDTKYDGKRNRVCPVAWYVTWDVYVNSLIRKYGEKNCRADQTLYR